MRLKYIDIVKGIAIFLVVLGHTIEPGGFVAKSIFSFHMPLFFIIAGYLFNFEKYDHNFREFFRGRIFRLLFPYFVSAFLFFMIYLLYESPKPFIYTPFYVVEDIFKSIFISCLYGVGAINSFNITPIGPLWFLPALFCAEMLFYLFNKLSNLLNIWFRVILFSVISYIGILIGQKIFLPWNIDIALAAMIFVFIGYELRKNKILERFSEYRNQILYYCVISAICLLWFFMSKNSFLSMNDRQYNNYIYAYIAAISASFVIFSICYKIQNLKILSFINNKFSFIGAETLIILVMHSKVIHYTPVLSCLRYNDFIFAIYVVLFCLMIGLVVKRIPLLNKCYYPNINKKKDKK